MTEIKYKDFIITNTNAYCYSGPNIDYFVVWKQNKIKKFYELFMKKKFRSIKKAKQFINKEVA